MRFYQMEADYLAQQLNSDINTGLTELADGMKPPLGNRAQGFIISIFKSVRSKLSLAAIVPLICYLIALVFSFLNQKWSLLLWTFIALIITVLFCAVEEQILFFYKKKYQKRIAAEEKNISVIRGGIEHLISADELRIGDLVRLQEGSILCGDARILRSEHLFAMETAVFGTNIPTAKQAELIEQDNIPPEEQSNMLWRGSYVHAGNGWCMITALNEDCYIEKTGGRKKKTQHSVFYNRQNNVGHWVTFIYSVLVIVFLMIAAFITGRYEESFLMIAAATSMVILNPVSALIEWTYYRTANKLYDFGILVRNFEAFDQMERERDVFFDLNDLLKETLTFSHVTPIVGTEENILTSFALCVRNSSLYGLIHAPMLQHKINETTISQMLIGSRCSIDAAENHCGLFMTDRQTVAVVAGYWHHMYSYIDPMDEALLHHIDELERHGKLVYVVAQRGADESASFPENGFKALGLIVFNVQSNKRFLDITHQLHRAGVRTHLINPYNQRFGDSIAALYDMDDAMVAPFVTGISAVSVDSLPIEKEKANLIYNRLDLFTRAVYQVKCMYCGLKRAMCYIGIFGLFMILSVFVMLLNASPTAAILVPILLMRLLLLAPGYSFVESTRNCNQFKRSLVLGLFCGSSGFISALLCLDMALLTMQVSTLFLTVYLLFVARSYSKSSTKKTVLLLLLLITNVLPWLFMPGNWAAMLLTALFTPLSALILDRFY